MLFDGVLLASDYDGTLVPSDKQVTEGVKKAVAFFIANGGRFTVSTGRTYLGFHSYSNEYINAPVLLANGGMAYDYEAKKIAIFDGIGDEGVEPVSFRSLPSSCIRLTKALRSICRRSRSGILPVSPSRSNLCRIRLTRRALGPRRCSAARKRISRASRRF